MRVISAISMKCPVCSKELDGHEAEDRSGAIPREGDLTVCSGCGALCIYVGAPVATSMRVATQAEIDEYERELPESLHGAIAWAEATIEVTCTECNGTGLVPATWVDDEQPNKLCPACGGAGTWDETPE